MKSKSLRQKSEINRQSRLYSRDKAIENHVKQAPSYTQPPKSNVPIVSGIYKRVNKI